MSEEKIKFCTKCLYSNKHPFGITFDNSGICSGCQIHEEKNELDWRYRLDKIKKIIKPYISKNRKNYDCIVPVTGGNDSFFIVHLVKNILKLNPLLVCYNKYFNTPIGIRNIANLRTKFDADILYKNINMHSVKKITRFTLLEHQSIYWPILAGHTVFPLEIAQKYKIPLIIWGAHQGIEQVGMFSHKNEVEMSRRHRENHDLFNVEADDLIRLDNDITEEDVYQFRYPSDKTINEIGIRGIYLSNYFRWDPTEQHKKMVKDYDYKCKSLPRTFDTYDHVDCYNYINLHDYLKLSKRGYSKITDHVCREIRHNRLSRDEGINLIQLYEQKPIENLNMFCEWLDIEEKSLCLVLNRSKNPEYWEETDINKFKFRGLSTHFEIKNNIDIKKLNKKIKINFLKNFNENKKTLKKAYIYFGKGVGGIYD